jgi:hypothetical protein
MRPSISASFLASGVEGRFPPEAGFFFSQGRVFARSDLRFVDLIHLETGQLLLPFLLHSVKENNKQQHNANSCNKPEWFCKCDKGVIHGSRLLATTTSTPSNNRAAATNQENSSL